MSDLINHGIGYEDVGWFRRWRAGAPERRMRRQIRKESFVYCEGDTASHWSGIGGDYDVCFMEECQQPNGGRCLAAMQSEVRYRIKCAAAGIEP
jgi:hypothetical protein